MQKLSEKLVILYILLSDAENHSVNDYRLDESYCIYWCVLFYYKVLPFARWCFFGIRASWLVDAPAIYLDGTIKLSLEVLRQPIKWKRQRWKQHVQFSCAEACQKELSSQFASVYHSVT